MSSLFPEVDDEIKAIKKDYQIKLKQFILGKRFEPSNGTEGMRFEGYCQGCSRYSYENPKCKIDINFWMGEFQDEIIEHNGDVMCVKHTKFDLRKYNE